MTVRPRRSVLYMPGSNARALEKARTLPADGVILDLEDSVAPDAKPNARDQVANAVRAGGFGYRECVVRINALSSEWGAADLDAVCTSAPDAVLIPKVASADDIADIARHLAAAGNTRTRIWAMMETPGAMLAAGGIAAAATRAENRFDVLVMGTNDLVKDTRALFTPDRIALVPWLSTCVAAARAHGLAILDGVFNDLADAEGFQAECEQGRVLGMDGKTIIHPKQIAPCNNAYSPSDADVASARAVLAAFDRPENQGRGVITVDGRMVERLHADIAAQVVAIADAVAQRQ